MARIKKVEERGWDIRIKTTAPMSIRKTGIVRWRGSGFFANAKKET